MNRLGPSCPTTHSSCTVDPKAEPILWSQVGLVYIIICGNDSKFRFVVIWILFWLGYAALLSAGAWRAYR